MSEELTGRRRLGKIAQCPRVIRQGICERLDDGVQGRDILSWANAQGEVQRLIAEKWEGEPLNDNNLSQWFKGGFQDWRRDQVRIEETTAKAELSLRLAKAAGGSIAEGAVAVAAGKIMTELEGAEGDELVKLAAGAATLRTAELNKDRITLGRARVDQRAEVIALARQRFERDTAEMFLKFYTDKKAIEIAESGERKEIKMDQLMALMFGQRPATGGPA
jgi:hypothetical protein